MQIKIFVVTTVLNISPTTTHEESEKIELDIQLLKCKTDLIRLYKGLTEYKNAKGYCITYWMSQEGKIESDTVDIWEIYIDESQYFKGLPTKSSQLTSIIQRIKEITRQKIQAYTIDQNMLFL